MMGKMYIVYDSRATPDDTDDANVLEVLDESDCDYDAIIEARELWSDQHAMVFRYDDDGKEIHNSEFVGCVDDYDSFPRAR